MKHWHRVTDDPELHAELRREEELGTPAVVELAHSHGLYPPGWPVVDAGIVIARGSDDTGDRRDVDLGHRGLL